MNVQKLLMLCRFVKGLRTYGKNFFKIRTELLPEKETGELITFYYLWKKTPGAANNRPRGRRHRPNVLRRVKSKENGGGKDKEKRKDTSSAREAEDSGDEGKYQNPYHCRHCLATTSKDWHHAGKVRLLSLMFVLFLYVYHVVCCVY